MNDALDVLARMNPRPAAIAETMFFAVLGIPGTAAWLNVSEATILRDCRSAKAWLAQELRHAG